jgi:predicted transcriptional regulator
MSPVYDQVLEILSESNKTHVQIAHETTYSFRTVKAALLKLTKENKIHVCGYFVYPNGMFKYVYALGKKPVRLKIKRPSCHFVMDIKENLKTVRAILPATATDVYSYFEWPREYVQKLLDMLVETYTVEKHNRKAMTVGDRVEYRLTEAAKAEEAFVPMPMWDGWNDVKEPNVVNGVAIRTTWRHVAPRH